MEYVKINSLWKRHGWYFDAKDKTNTSPELQAKRQSLIEGDYACPEFGNIRRWSVEEKVDGTNIRIIYKDGEVSIGGRTANSQIPCALLQALQKTFTRDAMSAAFPHDGDPWPNVVLYGEGYGPKIQAVGHNYRGDPGFILFDVRVGSWWLKRDDVKAIAHNLGVAMVPQLGVMDEATIVQYVKSKPLSLCSRIPQVMEGVVARSEPLMLTRSGSPVMFKLKVKEFVA